MTFEEARQKLAEMSRGEYRQLQYGLTEYSDSFGGGVVPECTVYIHNQKHHSGLTWEAALHSLDVAMHGGDAVDLAESPTVCHKPTRTEDF